jgi:hypothetical protein
MRLFEISSAAYRVSETTDRKRVPKERQQEISAEANPDEDNNELEQHIGQHICEVTGPVSSGPHDPYREL